MVFDDDDDEIKKKFICGAVKEIRMLIVLYLVY